MEFITTTIGFELEHGGPHVHFLAFILFIIIGILILHGLFRLLIEALCRMTHVSRDNWRSIFRFMPTLLGILLGIQLTKDILNLPAFVQNSLSYHYHSVVIITITFFCAHMASSFLKDKLSKSGDKTAGTSILTTVVDLGVYLVGALFILSSYGISISPLLTALGAGVCPGTAGYIGQSLFRYYDVGIQASPYGRLHSPGQRRCRPCCRYELAQHDDSDGDGQHGYRAE